MDGMRLFLALPNEFRGKVRKLRKSFVGSAQPFLSFKISSVTGLVQLYTALDSFLKDFFKRQKQVLLQYRKALLSSAAQKHAEGLRVQRTTGAH
jgi:hypothetical protein